MDTLDDLLPQGELDSVDEPVEVGDIPGTFVVSGLLRRVDYARHDRRGYLHWDQRSAMIWCIKRYGRALPVANVPGWAWAFRVPIPQVPLERDETIPYHMGWGKFRAVEKKGSETK